jgi:hypothetical protein
MRTGKLLAIDTPPNLSDQFIPGHVFEVTAQPILDALHALTDCPGVLRVRLLGDHLSALSTRETKARDLRKAMRKRGFAIKIQSSEPGLEDVFLAMSTEN